jgi:hypothetical protein
LSSKAERPEKKSAFFKKSELNFRVLAPYSMKGKEASPAKENRVMTSITFPADQLTLQELVEKVMAKALATGHSYPQSVSRQQ